jgi:hypothetical protein
MSRLFWLSPVVGAIAARQRVRGAFVRAGNQLNEADEVPPVDRQVLHLVLRDQGAHRGRIGLQQRCLRRHLHRVGETANSELGIDANALSASQIDARLLRPEALEFDADLIAANREQVHDVVSRCAGDRRANLVRADVVDGDGRTGQHRTAFIGDAAHDVTGGDLCAGNGGEQKNQQDRGAAANSEHSASP